MAGASRTLGALAAALVAPIRSSPPLLAALAAAVHIIRLRAGTPASYGRCRCCDFAPGYAWIALVSLCCGGVSGRGGGSDEWRRCTPLPRWHRRADARHDGACFTRAYRPHAGTRATDDAGFCWQFNLAALIRVGAPLFFPGSACTDHGAGRTPVDDRVGLFAAIYSPILLRPRIDGKPG